MKHFILAVFIAGLFALSTPDSHACSCALPDVAEAYDEARAVFAGEVTEIVKPRTDDPKAPLTDRLYTVKFKVEKSWKGVGFLGINITEVIILSDQGRAGCLSWGSFLEGEKYLVYAQETDEKHLAALFFCNRTASLDLASEDLKALKGKGNFTFNFSYRKNRQK